ncbi:MAG: four helix bundle protein [Chloroflexaceae bacterium]|nr:four helix bundle protein [Chloroflexaceae bacterium]NJL33471.1 four helix bundle protein [Chloroflexaceae bacterium]NJO05652.1 four helix bundle protein [Chloroflexaceae bacterium]
MGQASFARHQGLVDQIRCSSVSVPSTIAEGDERL